MQSRLRSKPLWAAIFSLILFVLKMQYNFEIEEYDKLLDLILVIATLLGILNNPTDKRNF